MRKTTMSWIKALPLLLLTAGPLVSSAPAKTSESKPVDRLVAAAQSALQQAKQNSSVAQDHDLNLGRHKGDSFTSPVDGYFIQARLDKAAAVYACLA